jgi:hypothetical protein
MQQVGSYAEYCLRERAYTSALTLEAPGIRRPVTPAGTRSTPAEFVTSGWFIGHIPLALSFSATARAAQACVEPDRLRLSGALPRGDEIRVHPRRRGPRRDGALTYTAALQRQRF